MPGIQNGLRRKSRIGPQEHCDQPGDDRCIALRVKEEFSIALERPKPDLRLATFHLVLVGLALGRERGQAPAQIDEVLVAVHPVVEKLELVDDFLMDFLDGRTAQSSAPNFGFYRLSECRAKPSGRPSHRRAANGQGSLEPTLRHPGRSVRLQEPT